MYRCLRLGTFREFSSFNNKSFGCYDIVVPGKVSKTLSVPSQIKVPTHLAVEQPQVRSKDAIKKIRKSCETAKNVLHYAVGLAKVGVTTDEIDKAVHSLCIDLGVYPSPLGYCGFPKSVCTSVNNVVCHGIPDDRQLKDGDIITIDVSVYQDGYHGDCCRTVLVGNVDAPGVDLVKASDACLEAGISVCGPGCPFHCIGEAVEKEAFRRGFHIVPSVAGHGIGKEFHESPDIYHFADGPDFGVMVVGNTFTIEPALTQGDGELEILEDGWTAVTVDGSRSAQSEHTILITREGAEILTQ